MLCFWYSERFCLSGLYLPSLGTCKVQSPSWHVVEAHELIFLDHVTQKQELKQWRLWPPVPQEGRDSINFQRWQHGNTHVVKSECQNSEWQNVIFFFNFPFVSCLLSIAVLCHSRAENFFHISSFFPPLTLYSIKDKILTMLLKEMLQSWKIQNEI